MNGEVHALSDNNGSWLRSEHVEEWVLGSEGDHGSLWPHGLLLGRCEAAQRLLGHWSGKDGDGGIRPWSEGWGWRLWRLGDIVVEMEPAS